MSIVKKYLESEQEVTAVRVLMGRRESFMDLVEHMGSLEALEEHLTRLCDNSFAKSTILSEHLMELGLDLDGDVQGADDDTLSVYAFISPPPAILEDQNVLEQFAIGLSKHLMASLSGQEEYECNFTEEDVFSGEQLKKNFLTLVSMEDIQEVPELQERIQSDFKKAFIHLGRPEDFLKVELVRNYESEQVINDTDDDGDVKYCYTMVVSASPNPFPSLEEAVAFLKGLAVTVNQLSLINDTVH